VVVHATGTPQFRGRFLLMNSDPAAGTGSSTVMGDRHKHGYVDVDFAECPFKLPNPFFTSSPEGALERLRSSDHSGLPGGTGL
jgi:hypothetical protein